MAVKQRFRPILMTSMAFILGVTPLAIATGAGSGSENAIGIAVMGGMIAATTLAIFFVPMFYVAVQELSGGERKKSKKYTLKSFDTDDTNDPIAYDDSDDLNHQG